MSKDNFFLILLTGKRTRKLLLLAVIMLLCITGREKTHKQINYENWILRQLTGHVTKNGAMNVVSVGGGTKCLDNCTSFLTWLVDITWTTSINKKINGKIILHKCRVAKNMQSQAEGVSSLRR